jgi:hypothetical protein
MSKRDTGYLNTSAKAELLKFPDGKTKYMIFIMFFKFLRGLRHIVVDPTIMHVDVSEIEQKVSELDCNAENKLVTALKKAKFLRGFRATYANKPSIQNVKDLMEEVKKWHQKRVNQSRINLLICDDTDALSALSIIVRKLKYPFLTGIEHFDKHSILVARQKLEKLLQVIPPEIMAKLNHLDTPFQFESELPKETVEVELELLPVNRKTLRSELSLLPRYILSALLALMTNTAITRVHTKCDNQRYEGCFEGLRRRVEQMTSGEIPANQDTHWNAQHCRNHHGCPSCRALCAMMTILRYPSNPDIGKHIARCVWHGSIFAELAMRHFLIMTLGPTCALAQVVNNPESPHREMLIQRLIKLKVQETPEEKTLREQQDAADRQIEIAEFRHHDNVEWHLNEAERKFQEFIYGLGYDPRITGSI